MKQILTALFAVVLLCSSASAVEYVKIVSGWTIGFETTSVRTVCFMETVYEGQTTFRFSTSPVSGQFLVALSNPTWKSVEDGKEYDVTVGFNGQAEWNGQAIGKFVDGAPVIIIPGDKVTFLSSLYKKHTIQVYYGQTQVVNLSLKGSANALNEVGRCQKIADGVPSADIEKADPFEVRPLPTRKEAADPFRL